MSAKAATWVGVVLIAVALVLLLVFFLDLLPWLVLALGLFVFAILVAGLLFGAVLLLVAVPYYLVAKPARISPSSSMGIDRIREP